MRTRKPTEIFIDKYNKKYFIEKKALFGLCKWIEIIHIEKISSTLQIATEEEVDKVYVNGVEYMKYRDVENKIIKQYRKFNKLKK